MFNQKLSKKIECGDDPLHNRLHGSNPPQPKHHDFTRRVVFHPLENTRHAKPISVYEPEGREFDSLRARHSPPIQFAHRTILPRKHHAASCESRPQT